MSQKYRGPLGFPRLLGIGPFAQSGGLIEGIDTEPERPDNFPEEIDEDSLLMVIYPIGDRDDPLEFKEFEDTMLSPNEDILNGILDEDRVDQLLKAEINTDELKNVEDANVDLDEQFTRVMLAEMSTSLTAREISNVNDRIESFLESSFFVDTASRIFRIRVPGV